MVGGSGVSGAPNSAKFRGVADLTKGGYKFFLILQDKNINILEFLR